MRFSPVLQLILDLTFFSPRTQWTRSSSNYLSPFVYGTGLFFLYRDVAHRLAPFLFLQERAMLLLISFSCWHSGWKRQQLFSTIVASCDHHNPMAWKAFKTNIDTNSTPCVGASTLMVQLHTCPTFTTRPTPTDETVPNLEANVCYFNMNCCWHQSITWLLSTAQPPPTPNRRTAPNHFPADWQCCCNNKSQLHNLAS
jgi:hypothetical protein